MDTPAVFGRRLHADFGLEVEHADLRDSLPDYVWEALRQALWEHALLVFRHQALSGADITRIARQFGASSSGVKRFETVGPTPDQAWHAVGAIEDAPASATLLCSREAPPRSGGMEFTSTRVVLAALSAEDRRLLEGVTASHVFRADPDRSIRWPLVVQQPRNGKASLLLGYHVVAIECATALPAHLAPDALITRATTPEHVYRHDFGPDDVLLWDNSSLMHRACALMPGERCVIEEIAVKAG